MTFKKPASSVNEPPLERQERIEFHSELGIQISITTLQRGLLGEITESYEPSGVAPQTDVSPRKAFEELCESLRDELHSFGLPSDRAPYWVCLGANDWRSISDPRKKIEGVTKRSFWIFRVRELTEPLSRPRLTGDLLFELLNLLGCAGIDNHLGGIGWLVESYCSYMIAGGINLLATAEIEARKSRANGPRIRKARADEVHRS